MDTTPVHGNQHAGGQRHAGAPHGKQQPAVKSNRLKVIALGIATALIVGALIVVGWLVYRSSMPAHIDSNKHQAVFFTNGQVYFGKLHKLSGGYFKMTDVFYLQTKAEDKEESANPQETSAQDASDVQLIKLGGEIHGPEDEMIMSKDQILFFENLKESSTVSKTIDEYNNENK